MIDKDQESFEIETTYTIHYSTSKPVPIDEIIESLKSLEKLIKRTPGFIEAAYGNIDIVDVQVYVNSLSTGSLTEKFMIKYIFRGKPNYEKAKEVWDQMLSDNTMIRTVVAMGIGSLITFGAMSAIGTSGPANEIKVYDNTIVNVGGQVDLTASDIKMVLDGIKDKKALAKESVGAVRPAKSDPDATIEMSGLPELTLNEKYIREVPSEYEPPVPDEKEEKYTNVRVLIYASDRDKAESNWAGIVPGVVDKRVRFMLDEKIDPKKLHGRTEVRADITVVSRYVLSKKSYEPKQVLIRTTN